MELTPKNTEYASYATSGLTFIDSISTDYMNTIIALIGVIGTLLVNTYFNWKADKRKEEKHRRFMSERIQNEKTNE